MDVHARAGGWCRTTFVENIAGIECERVYDLTAPQGVRRRNSNNTLVSQVLGWEPPVPLEEGMARTYDWIYEQMSSSAATRVLERLI
jgi:nucleoside-diphosphate-sugar epimerase